MIFGLPDVFTFFGDCKIFAHPWIAMAVTPIPIALRNSRREQVVFFISLLLIVASFIYTSFLFDKFLLIEWTTIGL
jgi:hypothetical protein